MAHGLEDQDCGERRRTVSRVRVDLVHCDVGHQADPSAKSKRARKRHVQVELFRHGGQRRGAGRKPKGARAKERHDARPEFKSYHPLHVVMRIVPAVGAFRSSEDGQLPGAPGGQHDDHGLGERRRWHPTRDEGAQLEQRADTERAKMHACSPSSPRSMPSSRSWRAPAASPPRPPDRTSRAHRVAAAVPQGVPDRRCARRGQAPRRHIAGRVPPAPAA